MMNKQLYDEVRRIGKEELSKHNIQAQSLFFSKEPLHIIECGGGWSTIQYLIHISVHGGKLTTIDLCTYPEQKIFIEGIEVGTGGSGDYSSKKEFFNKLMNNKIIREHFKHEEMDAYEFFKNFEGEVEYYFDDGCHFSDYLIPLFDMVISKCKDGAIIGSHDISDGPMQEFVAYLREKDNLKLLSKNDSIFMGVTKK